MFIWFVCCCMNLSRRTFVAGSVGGMIALAGCSGDDGNGTPTSGSENSTQNDTDSNSDGGSTEEESWTATSWGNPNASLQADIDTSLSDDGSEFTVGLSVERVVDYVWVDVTSQSEEPEDGWFSTATNVPDGVLEDYSAIQGGVLLNGNVGRGGAGTECGVNLENAEEMTVIVMGGVADDTVMDETEVLEVHSLSKM